MIELPDFDRIVGSSEYDTPWRKLKGILIHAAATLEEPLHHNNGIYAVLCCEPDLAYWVNHDRADKHLRYGHEVSCKSCLKRLGRKQA